MIYKNHVICTASTTQVVVVSTRRAFSKERARIKCSRLRGVDAIPDVF